MKKTREGYPVWELSHKGLKVEMLSKKYRRFQLKDISFEIPPGSILGLLGRNGAGKTTAMKLLTGHTKKKAAEPYGSMEAIWKKALCLPSLK